MQYHLRLIVNIFVITLLVGILEGNQSGSKTVNERDKEKFLANALQAINEIEVQRQMEKGNPTPVPQQRQRLNSKRLRWRQNNRFLQWRPEKEINEKDVDSKQHIITSSSMSQNVIIPNADYLNVKDYAPTDPPWWFN
ncbi:uncharacterized protein Dwil_GK27433 [Drosophila willistoni]|uniref:Uncharacterized protein n=1 Tax=Drosophila willistoni TaxID=7260 RepID=A0A0Q9X126_DROWI|nr:uncharacterized protein LOC124460481 [Drosophila willistoni]KRF99577.1 uncharacterized protein Dwil_GK27433 [Drosophila willistoni]